MRKVNTVSRFENRGPSPRRSGFGHAGGFVLIIALAVLAVLALLGISFVTLQSMNKDTAKSYLDDKRAIGMAESGLQDAVSTLKSMASLPEGLFATSGGAAAWLYKDDVTVAVEASQKPSFAQGKTVKIDGKRVDYSGGTTLGDYGQHGNQYTLKIVDTSSQIYVNDFKNLFLKRILDALGDELGAGSNLGDKIVDGRPTGGYPTKQALIAVLGKTTFDKVKDYVAVHAWVDTKVVNPVPLSAEEEDTSYPVKMARPVAVAHSHSDTEALSERKKHIYRLGHNADIFGNINARPLRFASSASVEERYVFGLDEVHAQYIEKAARAPININTAPKPVLVALLKGLSGFTIAGTTGTSGTRGYPRPGEESIPVFHSTNAPRLTFGGNPGAAHDGQLGMLTRVQLSDAEARAVADKIIENREKTGAGLKPWEGPFRTWEQFNAFCDSLIGSTVTDVTRELAEAKADILKANFNPNTHLNEMNPDAPMAMRVDKTDLVSMSSEFCFLPTGYFEIESVGRVLKPTDTGSALTAGNNVEIAVKKIYAVVHLYDLVRQTTQRDFAGDPANASTLSVLSNSNSPVSNPTNNGKGLQVGPASMGMEVSETEYDGFVSLSTVGGTPGAAAPAPGQVAANPSCAAHTATELLHIHFQNDLRANYHRGGINQHLPRRYDINSANNYFFNQPTATAGLAETLHGPYSLYDYFDPAIPAAKRVHEYRQGRSFEGSGVTGSFYAPSNHHIDGAYSGRHQALLYDAVSIVGAPFPYYGTVSYWMKPGFYPENTAMPRTFFSMSRMHDYGVNEWNPTPFAHYFLPSQQTQTAFDSAPYYTNRGVGAMNFPTRSFGFGFGWTWSSGYGVLSQPGENEIVGGALSKTLNKRYTVPGLAYGISEDGIVYKDAAKVSTERSSNPMKANRWMFVILPWDARGGFTGPGTTASADKAWEIYVNGAVAGTTKFIDPDTSFTRSVRVARANPSAQPNVFNAASHTPTRPTSSYLMYCGGGGYSYSPPPRYEDRAVDCIVADDPQSISVTETLIGGVWQSSTTINGQLISAPSFHGGGGGFAAGPARRVVTLTASDQRARWAAGGWDPTNPFYITGERYTNPVRIGEPSLPMNSPTAHSAYKRNFPAEATVDELFMYSDKAGGFNAAIAQWGKGRFYRENDASFVSGTIDLQSSSSSSLPPKSPVSDPNGDSAPVPAPRILGLTWTAYNTTLYDYKFSQLRDAKIEFTVSPDGGTKWFGVGGVPPSSLPDGVPGVATAAWSPIQGAEVAGSTLKYSFRMNANADSLNSILLETPILDDVTIYVEVAGSNYVEYIVM